MTYADLAAARGRGADPSNDGSVLAALAEADRRVNDYTGDVFAPTGVQSVWGTSGLREPFIPLGPRLRTVTSVATERGTVLPVSSYRPILGGAIGARNGLLLLDLSGSDILVVGAEPWNGGYTGLLGLGSRDGREARLEVVGTYGWDSPPSAVVEAAAVIAALLAPTLFTPQADAEGNPAGLPSASTSSDRRDPRPEPVSPADRQARSTGSAEADRLLTPYVVGGGWRISGGA